MNKRLSIVTINFNQIEALKLTLNSIRNAACNKNLFQLIVIDGRSTDGSAELLRDYADVISIGISEPDKGIFDAMNKGLNYATGDYVIFMNSGDTFCGDILNINFIEKLNGDIIYGDFYLKSSKHISYYQQTDKLDFAYLLGKTICHQSLFLKTSLCQKYRFDTNYRLMGDWIQLFKILKYENPAVRKLDIPVCVYDGNGQSEIYKDIRIEERIRFLNTMYTAWELETLLPLSRMRGRNWYLWVFGALDRLRRHYVLGIMSKLVR